MRSRKKEPWIYYYSKVTSLAMFLVFTLSLSYAETEDASLKTNEELSHVRQLLTGPEKNLAGARKELLQLTQNDSKELSSSVLCMSYIYLGYIEDIKGNRQDAMQWYKKATMVDSENIKHTLSLARSGLRMPITWIRHLDHGVPRTPSKSKKTANKSIMGQIGKGFIYINRPPDQGLQQKLTPAEMEENFEILVQAIDQYFSFFTYKGIDLEKIHRQYQGKLKEIKSTQQFYKMIYQFVRELEDAHSRLENYKSPPEIPPYAPPISFRRIDGKPVVIDVWKKSRAYREGVRPGWILTKVNRSPADRHLEFLQDHVSVSSSQRNLKEKVTRMILCGRKGSWVKLDFLSTEGKLIQGLEMARSVSYPVTEPKPPLNLTRLKTIQYGRHSSGCGYIRILTFKGRLEIADEFDQALEQLRHTDKLIIDIRDNIGGYGTSQKRIIGRFLAEKKLGITSYFRDGSEHNDFTKKPEFISPCGDWQYSRSVGLLMNPMTGSASDLFAARFISTGRIISMGQTTHGNLTGRGVYALLPCNLIVRISNGYISNANDQVIEGNGNEPDIIIEPTIKDAQQEVDGVLERAFKELTKRV